LVESYVNVNTFNAEIVELEKRDRRENPINKMSRHIDSVFLCASLR